MRRFWSIVKRIAKSEYLSLVLRCYLGILFIYASMSKIPYPAEFAESLASYQIVPYWVLNFVAVALPWVEATCGLFLVIGLTTRAASFVIGSLLICFTLAQTINLIRGIPISCGCFQNAGDQIIWWDIPKDLGWFLLTMQVFFLIEFSCFARGICQQKGNDKWSHCHSSKKRYVAKIRY